MKDKSPHSANGSEVREAKACPAAQYVRMSTEHQRYSTENQADVIADYATKHDMAIVRTYEDEGKSGLRIAGRDGLRRMIDDVQTGKVPFRAILVYDVSRWGRFQDADESAYYEYICKRAGIEVHYCAEQFANDGSPVSTIVKGVKRAMAGEYSRELSTKVFQGQCRLIQLGYRQGGAPGYGLRRMLVDEHGQPKYELRRNDQKSLQTDRVILVPGPPDEVQHVRQIYRLFVDEGKTETEIAASLNAEGVVTDLGRPWTRGVVRQILTNEKYIGNNVYNRRSFKLKRKHVTNPPEMWVRKDGAFKAIVDVEDFYRAQGIILQRARRYSNEEMLAKLRVLYQQHGRVSGILIDEADDMPCASAYRARFGSLVSAYRLVGYTPEVDYSFIEINRRLRALHPEIVEGVVRQLHEQGSTVEQDDETGLLLVNGEITVSLVVSRCTHTQAGSQRWCLRLEHGLRPDITIAVRMDESNGAALDYYLLPSMDMTFGRLRLAEFNGVYLDAYRFDSLDAFFELTERVHLEAV